MGKDKRPSWFKMFRHQKPLFVIISNFTSPTLEREVMTSGAAYFAVSPFNASELAERIVQILAE